MIILATPNIYRSAASAFTNKEWEWDADAFSALLVTTSYTFNQDTHVFVTDLTGELSGGSYARVALSTKTFATAAGVVKLLCDDIVFAAMTATNVNAMVVFRNTGSDATSKLFCCLTFDASVDPTAQTITIDLNTDGLVNLTVS